MQFVEAKDLKPGMRLAKPIYNKNGVLLYERDTKLSVQVINNIQNFMLIGVYILEPAEPLPPLSKEELEFEQFQTVAMFQLRTNIDLLKNEKGSKPWINEEFLKDEKISNRLQTYIDENQYFVYYEDSENIIFER